MSSIRGGYVIIKKRTEAKQLKHWIIMNKLSYVEVLLLGMAVASFTMTVFVLGNTFF